MNQNQTNIKENNTNQPKRKLEYFEDLLKSSEQGREVIKVFQMHFEEIFYLINKNRSVAVTWQRNQGPAFIRAIVDSGFDENTIVPKNINGISLEKLLLKIINVLQQKGSIELRNSIAKYAYQLLFWTKNSNSLLDVINHFNKGITENNSPIETNKQCN